MPISGQTIEKLRQLTALLCCPSCGKRSEQMESLTSCGHYLCANCVNSFVLNSDNKCPKCYTINRRNDCREDVFVNTVVKVGHKINKLLDKQSSNQSESTEVSEQLVAKPKELPKKNKSDKELVIESIKSCLSKESKSKPKNSSSSTLSATDHKSTDSHKEKKEMTNTKESHNKVDDDIDSIPDSFDNELFTPSSRNGENTDMVSMILEGLESNCDPETGLQTSEENGSGDQSKSLEDNKNVETNKKSCSSKPTVKNTGVQTRVILQNVSIQTEAQSSVTDTVVEQTSTDCQSNDCCFHKFVETVSCSSLKTFLKSLMELKDRPQEAQQLFKTLPTSEPVVTDSHKIETNQIIVDAIKAEIQPKDLEPISSFDLIPSNSTEDSPPPSIPLEVKEDNQKKTINKRKISEDKPKTKRTVQTNKTKKMKAIELSDEEMDETIEESKIEEPVIPLNVIQIESSNSTSKANTDVEESTSKPKPRIKGPKSRQMTASKKEKISEESKKRKAPTTYVSSDDEVEDVVKTDVEEKTITEEKVKRNRKKTQNNKNSEKSVLPLDATTDDTTVDEQESNDKKRTVSASGLKKRMKKTNVEKVADVLTEKSKTKSVSNFSKDETEEENESNDSIVRPKRKGIPKKKFPMEDSDEEKESAITSKKRQNIKTNDSITSGVKNSNYKPRPKSKQKSPLKEANDVFKRPASPTISVSDESSISSTSSRQRTSSSERSNQKRVILFSGLDDKQKKKIENVCRELDAEAVSDWSDKVTHLVIALAEDRPKKDMICPRNAKYIKALLNNIWIVSYDWIIDSSRSDRFVDETNYEIKGDKTATERGLPTVSRNSRQKLFAKRMVKFEGKFGNILNEFREFIEIGGGIVVQSDEEFDKNKSKTGSNKLIVVTEAVGLPNTQKDGIKYISKKAFMDNISNFIQI